MGAYLGGVKDVHADGAFVAVHGEVAVATMLGR